MKPYSKIFFAVLFILLLFAGFYLRAKNVFEIGITHRDEVWNLFGTQGLLHKVCASIDTYFPNLNTLDKFYQSNPSLEIFENMSSSNLEGKPLYLLFTSIIAITFNHVAIKEFPIFALSIFSGTVSILVIYFLSNLLWKKKTQSLLIALFFSISPLEVYYSRIGLTAAFLELFFLIFLLFFIKICLAGSTAKTCLALFLGIFMGGIFSIHPVFLFTIISILFFYILVTLKEKKNCYLKTASLFIGGILLSILLWELIYFVGKEILVKSGINSNTGFYLVDALKHGSDQGIEFKKFFSNILKSLSILISLGGVELFILFSISVIDTLKKTKKERLYATPEVFLIFLFFSVLIINSFSGLSATRNLVTIFPIISLLSGRGFYKLFNFTYKQIPKYFSAILCGIILIIIVIHSLTIDFAFLNTNGAWKKMGSYLVKNYYNKKIAVSGNGVTEFYEISDSAIISFYFGKAVQLPSSEKDFFDTCELYVYNLPSYHNTEYEKFQPIYSNIAPLIEFTDHLRAKRIFLSLVDGWFLFPSHRYLLSNPNSFKKGDDTIRLYNVFDIKQQFYRLHDWKEQPD